MMTALCVALGIAVFSVCSVFDRVGKESPVLRPGEAGGGGDGN